MPIFALIQLNLTSNSIIFHQTNAFRRFHGAWPPKKILFITAQQRRHNLRAAPDCGPQAKCVLIFVDHLSFALRDAPSSAQSPRRSHWLKPTRFSPLFDAAEWRRWQRHHRIHTRNYCPVSHCCGFIFFLKCSCRFSAFFAQNRENCTLLRRWRTTRRR